MKTTNVKTILRMAQDAAFYTDEVGDMFRMDHTEPDAEVFYVTHEERGEQRCIAACDVPDSARFYKLEEITEADYEE